MKNVQKQSVAAMVVLGLIVSVNVQSVTLPAWLSKSAVVGVFSASKKRVEKLINDSKDCVAAELSEQQLEQVEPLRKDVAKHIAARVFAGVKSQALIAGNYIQDTASGLYAASVDKAHQLKSAIAQMPVIYAGSVDAVKQFGSVSAKALRNASSTVVQAVNDHRYVSGAVVAATGAALIAPWMYRKLSAQKNKQQPASVNHLSLYPSLDHVQVQN